MCGACGTSSAADWASPVLGLRTARAAAAAVIAAAAARGRAIRAVPGGWTVRRPTGAGAVVGTLTDLVAATVPDPGASPLLPTVSGAHLPPPDRRRPVTLVHGEVADALVAGGDAWPDLVAEAGPPLVLAVADAPGSVLDRLLADPLRRAVRVTDLVGCTLPGWGDVPVRLPDVPGAVAPDRVPALAALLAIRLSGRPSSERTRTLVDVAGTTLRLEALGGRVLAFCRDGR
ncbi:hypothetical protein [Geodermatophilus sp. URMC 63]